MQRFVPPIFDESPPPPTPSPAESRSTPTRPVRWGMVALSGAVVLAAAIAAFWLTDALLTGTDRPLAPADAGRAPAIVMALLAAGATLGLIGLLQQLTQFLTPPPPRPMPDQYWAPRESQDDAEPTKQSARRRADELERSLRYQRRETSRLLAVLESIPEGLVVQDLDGRLLLINDAARALLGGSRDFEAARLHAITEVVSETLGPALAPGIYALGDPTRLPFAGKMLQAQAAALLSANSSRIGTVIVLRDITLEVEREQRRAALLDQLSEQVLAPRPPESYPSLAVLAQEVARNTRSVQRVITALQDLSTFEPHDLETEQRPLALNDLLRETAREWQPLALAAGVRLRVKFAPRGHHVLGDERRLRWALGNILDNALKYSPADSAVLIVGQVRPNDPAVAEIAIEDRGFGVGPDDLPHVFTRFYRGTVRDRKGRPVHVPGTGQGLYIAQRVIKGHGGALAIASQPGRGTTVTLTLPLTAPVTLELPQQADDTVRAAGSIVDTLDLDDTRDIPTLSLLPTDREVDFL